MSTRRWGRRQLLPLGVWLGGTVVAVALFGIPYTRDWVTVWVLAGMLAVSLSDVGGWVRGVVVDWLPFFAVLTAYDVLRGSADGLLFEAHYLPQLHFDEWLFGGTAPTVWLQERLLEPGRVQWFEVLAWLVYLTHFFLTPLVAAVLWVIDRLRFREFAVTVALLAFMGFATYALFPAAPPWLASERGLLEPTVRVIPQVWGWAGLGAADGVIATGYRYANDVAAVPSLHAAFSLLVVLFLWPRRWWLRVLAAAYPIAMALALVYGAEHYVSDVLLGWLYAVVATVSVRAGFARWRTRRAAGTEAPAATGRATAPPR